MRNSCSAGAAGQMGAVEPARALLPRSPTRVGALRGSAHHRGRTPCERSVDRFVAERVGLAVLRARRVGRRPAAEPAKEPLRLGVERLELRVLHPPATVQLLDDQLRVEDEIDRVGTELLGDASRSQPGSEPPRLQGSSGSGPASTSSICKAASKN